MAFPPGAQRTKTDGSSMWGVNVGVDDNDDHLAIDYVSVAEPQPEPCDPPIRPVSCIPIGTTEKCEAGAVFVSDCDCVWDGGASVWNHGAALWICS